MKIIPSSVKGHYLAKRAVFLLTVSLLVGIAGYGGICGVYNPPPSENLEIRTWYDLDAVRDNLDGDHTLMNDLDSTTLGYDELAGPTANGGKGWQPIGYWDRHYGFSGPVFRGILDGQGHEIRDLFINRPDEGHVGLFGVARGVIKDIGVVNANIIGDYLVGGLVGFSGSDNVSNSFSTGSVTGRSYIGGLVGRNHGTVSNCYYTGNVTGEEFVGGLVGVNGDTVSNSYFSGKVTGNQGVGGLLGGSAYGTVTNSFWDIQTSGTIISYGGIGRNTTEMQNVATFSRKGWDICPVNPGERNIVYIWNIVANVTYPFLSWQS